MLPMDQLREKLLAQRTALFRKVASAEDDLRWLDANVEPELEEEGQEENLARLLGRLDERGLQEIEAIDRALARMASGDYGRCEICGETIPLPRLLAVPVADACVSCATQRERLGAAAR